MRTQGGQVYVTSYAYDLADRLVGIVYPSGRIVSYERDSLGRVSAVRTQDNELAPVVTLASNFSYLPFGPLSGFQFGNGLASTLGHDQDYRQTGIVTSDGASNQVQDLALGYDANDHVSTIIDGVNPGRSQAFAYDELWRLEQAAGAYGTIDYGYDAGGNRLSRTITDGGSTVESYSYDALSHRLLSVDDGASVRSFGYATDGSVVSDDRGADVFVTYDATGRLAAIEKNGAPEAAYAYDAFGLRVYKDLTIGGTTHANYDPDGRLLAESAATGVADREYIWLPLDFAGADDQAWALPLALVTDAGTAGPRLHYLHADHLGTPVAMTSGGLGQLEWSAVLRPFGEVESITGTESLALRLPGQVFDPETGFHQNWRRDYDPRLGRYLQSDPIGLDGGLNTYAYVGGSPVNLVDPGGENPVLAAIVACARIAPCRNAATALALATVAAVQQALQPKRDFCQLPDSFWNETSEETPPIPEGPDYIGNNPQPMSGKSGGANTDLPGGEAAADELFDRLTDGAKPAVEPDGTRVGPNGVRRRTGRDGRPRVDIPAPRSGSRGPETIPFND